MFTDIYVSRWIQYEHLQSTGCHETLTNNQTTTQTTDDYDKPRVIRNEHVYEELKGKEDSSATGITNESSFQYEDISTVTDKEPRLSSGLTTELLYNITNHDPTNDCETVQNEPILSREQFDQSVITRKSVNREHQYVRVNSCVFKARQSKPLPLLPDEVENIDKLSTFSVDTAITTNRSLNSSDVGKLSIEELGHYLDVLNLSIHKDKFRIERVDGCLLQDIDKQVLQDEFGFSRFEALKLIKFAKSGYLPKSSRGSSEQDF